MAQILATPYVTRHLPHHAEQARADLRAALQRLCRARNPSELDYVSRALVYWAQAEGIISDAEASARLIELQRGPI